MFSINDGQIDYGHRKGDLEKAHAFGNYGPDLAVAL